MGALDQIKAGLMELALDFLKGKEPYEFTLIIEGEEFRTNDATVMLAMDTLANGTRVSVLLPKVEEKAAVLIPYQYLAAQIYLGGQLVLNGILYGVEPEVESQLITLDIWSPAADLLDCTIDAAVWTNFPNAKYERNNVTLADRVTELSEPFGLTVLDDADDTHVFERAACQPTDKVSDHLMELARQRGVLLCSDAQGQVVLQKANTSGSPVQKIEEGHSPFQNLTCKFDGRKRYSTYKAIGQSPAFLKNVEYQVWKHATSLDDGCQRSRFLCFQADDITEGSAQAAADWKRNKCLADDLKLKITVDRWYSDTFDNVLYKPNEIITVVSPSAFIPDGYDFLIRQVDFELKGGKPSASLHLVPPQSYTREKVTEPWKAASIEYQATTMLEKLQGEIGI